MSTTWIIVSWVFVAILTGINIFIFMKLKQASEQMLKMAFPGAKNMNDAMAQMQKMMGGMGGGMNRGPGGFGGGRQMGGRGALPGGGGGKNMDQQLKAAMDMLSKMQKK